MLKIAPCNKNLVTSAMFRISQKCFPAKHGKAGFPTTPHRSELDHTSSETEITPSCAPPLEDQWEDRPATDFFQFGLMKLILFAKIYLKHQEITLRIQRNKGNAGHKNVRSI